MANIHTYVQIWVPLSTVEYGIKYHTHEHPVDNNSIEWEKRILLMNGVQVLDHNSATCAKIELHRAI